MITIENINMRTITTLIITIMTILSGQILYAQGTVSRTIKSGNNKNTTQKANQHKTQWQKSLTGYINGHEWVDLGLPSGTKWATCNVGASRPEDYGSYFSWSDTFSRSNHFEHILTKNKSISELQTEGIIDLNGNLKYEYDAAYANWGPSWRIPNKDDYEELITECIWTLNTQKGKKGYTATGPNGKSIFFPLSGDRHKESEGPRGTGIWGSYWSATVYDKNFWSNYFYIQQENGLVKTNNDARFTGRSIRPILNTK